MTHNSSVAGDALHPDASMNRIAGLAGTVVFGTVLAYLGTRQPKEGHSMKLRDMPEGYKAQNEFEQKAIDAYEKRQNLSTIPWLFQNIRWVMSIYIAGVHVLALFALPHLLDCKWETLLGMFAFYVLGGFGITGGAHRLWSHRTYKANAVYRFVVMICNSIANQGTIYHWSRDHRTHHKYSETKADPHNALRGFFFAHVGWLFFKKDPRVKFAGNHIPMSDLAALPEVQLQKRLDPWWNLFWCFGAPTLCGHFLWGETVLNSFLLMGVLRYVLCLNGTWLVNSAAHLYGGHPYEDINPAENPVVAFFSMGEGWHNWHHAFPHDYSASELGVSSQFNPTRLVIDLCALFGIVWDRKTATDHWETRKKKKGYKHVDLQGAPLFRQRVVS